MKHYDFGGYATRFNVRCTDGRTIRRSAFDTQLPCRVPLVWQHQHNTAENCIGHCDLESRNDGVYAYCSFTVGDGISPAVTHARALVEHGDIDSLSIYANELVENGGDVMHGVIKEVSLVLAGANPGAKILETDISHDASGYFGGIIYPGVGEVESDIIMHADQAEGDEPESTEKEDKEMAYEKTVADVIETMDEDQQAAVIYLLNKQKEELSHSSLEHADEEAPKKEDNADETVGDVLDTLNDKQKAAVMYLLEQVKKNKGGLAAEKNDTTEEEKEMKHNAFEGRSYTGMEETRALSHADEQIIWNRFMNGEYKTLKTGILEYASKKGVLAHADTVDESAGTATYGIDDIEWLFPDAKVLTDEPMIIDRRQDWVKAFMDKATHLPYSRVKTIYADITGDDARAKGYAKKAQKKVAEVIKLLKHTTQPTTIYKMQKFDKDDLRDITSFDPLKWIDAEMTGKLHEEIARAALIGDGRDDLDQYKINEDCIVPISKANELFTIYSPVTVASDATDAEIAVEAMDQAVRAKKNYRGSGDATLFTTEDWISEMFLLKDVNGRRIFESEQAIANYMRVGRLQAVELMEGAKHDGKDIFGIIVNPKDYAFGSDHGSAIETFKQFDIDYNQEKILKEVRCSGALRVPYSAILLYINKQQ